MISKSNNTPFDGRRVRAGVSYEPLWKEKRAMSMDRLYNDVIRKGPVCVGLDTQYSFLPEYLKRRDASAGEKIFEFNRKIIDAVYEDAGCFKVQVACYEALGLEGMKAFADTVRYARGKGSIVISDVKRGDISSTAAQYAQGHFTGDFETDIITVNAYMGEDAFSPYYPYLEKGKGLFVLVKTSNPSSKDFQDLDAGGLTLYQRMAQKVAAWGSQFMGESGFTAIGAVTGLTYPEEFELIRDLMPHTFLLIPGYGAQGGHRQGYRDFFKGAAARRCQFSRDSSPPTRASPKRKALKRMCAMPCAPAGGYSSNGCKETKIAENAQIAEGVWRMRLTGAPEGRPGQFSCCAYPARWTLTGQGLSALNAVRAIADAAVSGRSGRAHRGILIRRCGRGQAMDVQGPSATAFRHSRRRRRDRRRHRNRAPAPAGETAA
jgi:orotidine-5'-phosphate decarboxylase